MFTFILFNNLKNRKASGKRELQRKVNNYFLDNIKDKQAKKEIAFFGGSFTAIEVAKQEELLSLAYEYIKGGKIKIVNQF